MTLTARGLSAIKKRVLFIAWLCVAKHREMPSSLKYGSYAGQKRLKRFGSRSTKSGKNIMGKTEIRKQLEKAIHAYLKAFEKKQEVEIEFSVCDDVVDGPFFVSDAYIGIREIVFDIDHSVPKGWVFDWYWEQVERRGKDAVNYEHYCMMLGINSK